MIRGERKVANITLKCGATSQITLEFGNFLVISNWQDMKELLCWESRLDEKM